MKRIVALIVLAGLAAGCTTSPSPKLYTVNMTPSAKAGSPVNIDIVRIRIAEALQNKRILIKKSPTEIEYYAMAQWAASLDEILREKLAVEFGPSDTTRPTFTLSGTLQSFEQVDMPAGNLAHVKLDMEVRRDGESQYATPAIARVYEVDLPIGDDSAGGVVEALSACLETVARDIVADVAGLQ